MQLCMCHNGPIYSCVNSQIIVGSMRGPNNDIRMNVIYQRAFSALRSLSFDTPMQLVVMLGMLATSLNLRRLCSPSRTPVRMYQSKLWAGVKIRQQKRRERVKECK